MSTFFSLKCLFFTGSFPPTFFSRLTHLITGTLTILFLMGLSFPFFLSPLRAFSKLNLHSTASNSSFPNFLLTIQPVCNLATSTTAPLKNCSCQSHQCPLDFQCQGPLFLSRLSSLLYLTPLTSTSLKFLVSFSAYSLLLFLVLDSFAPLCPSFESTFHFCLKLTTCTSCRYSI